MISNYFTHNKNSLTYEWCLIDRKENFSVPDDLTGSFDKAIAQQNTNINMGNMSVVDMFHNWHIQPGYPLVTATRINNNTLSLTQVEFIKFSRLLVFLVILVEFGSLVKIWDKYFIFCSGKTQLPKNSSRVLNRIKMPNFTLNYFSKNNPWGQNNLNNGTLLRNFIRFGLNDYSICIEWRFTRHKLSNFFLHSKDFW